jgi:hypothetical protein
VPDDPDPRSPAGEPPAGQRPVPRRVVVTAGPRQGRSTVRPVRARSEIDEQTALGAAYVRSLMRSQLRTAAVAFGILVALLGGLPVVFTLVPDNLDLWPSGPSLAWAVLGIAAYPLLVLIARWYVGRAERNERDFSDLVE